MAFASKTGKVKECMSIIRSGFFYKYIWIYCFLRVADTAVALSSRPTNFRQTTLAQIQGRPTARQVNPLRFYMITLKL